MNILRIKKIQEDAEIPTMNPNNTFDIRIHRFHKIDDLTGEIEEYNKETFYLQSCKRVLITTGYSLKMNIYHNISCDRFINNINIITRIQCAIKDGLIVLGHYIYKDELAVLLSLQSDSVLVLKKGYRVAVGSIFLVHETIIEKDN